MYTVHLTLNLYVPAACYQEGTDVYCVHCSTTSMSGLVRILKCLIIKFEDRCLLLVRLHIHTIRFHVLGVGLDMYLNGVIVCVFAYHV